jgi:hypothetical protein
MSKSEFPLLTDLLHADQVLPKRPIELNGPNEINDPHSRLIIENIFGDRYLIANNRIFRAVRKQSLELGFRFSNERSEEYEALPFTQLEKLISEKKIPIIFNRQAVEYVANKVPTATWVDIADGFRRCFAFHESCHAVARASFSKGNRKPNSPKCALLLRLLEESFANTCELFGIADCHDLTSLALYEANSYTALWEAKDTLQEVGWDPSAFFYVLTHYLRANFLAPPALSSAEQDQLLKIYHLASGSPKKPSPALEELAGFAYTLDENFRRTTSRLYLQLNNLPSDLEDNFLNPIEELASNSEVLKTTLRLCRFALQQTS